MTQRDRSEPSIDLPRVRVSMRGGHAADVEASYRRDGWAVTPCTYSDCSRGRFTVSHLPTGSAIIPYGIDHERALMLCRFLGDRFPCALSDAAFGMETHQIRAHAEYLKIAAARDTWLAENGLPGPDEWQPNRPEASPHAN